MYLTFLYLYIRIVNLICSKGDHELCKINLVRAYYFKVYDGRTKKLAEEHNILQRAMAF